MGAVGDGIYFFVITEDTQPTVVVGQPSEVSGCHRMCNQPWRGGHGASENEVAVGCNGSAKRNV
ncbi:MAG: hypothetical protein R3C68_00315 [Myxococcota bacterium]